MFNKDSLLKNLGKQFDEYEEEFNLLRFIDESAINEKLSIDEFFAALFERIRNLLHIENIGLFALVNNNYKAIDINDIHKSNIKRDIIPEKDKLAGIINDGNAKIIPVKYQGDTYFNLIVPLRIDKNIFSTIICQSSKNQDEYINEASIPFFEDVINRINIFLQYRGNKRFNTIKDNLITEFFNTQLTTQDCWSVIVDNIPKFLPDFKPFKIEPHPLVQVLTYRDGDKYMLLRASQGSSGELYNIKKDKISIPLKVDETICGLLIEQNQDFLLLNPHDNPNRYQAYLFGKDIPKSELVISVKYKNRLIALLNLEHQDEDVFNNYAIETLNRVSKMLSPFLNALLAQEDIQRKKEISLLYVMTDLLKRMASTYRHKINQVLLKSRAMINRIEDARPNQDEDFLTYLNNLKSFINEFQSRSKSFLKDVPNYIKYTGIDISKTIQDVIEEFDPDGLKNQNIYFDFIPLQVDIRVWASRMLKEHIYNLINNSLFALKERIAKNEIEKGFVKITIKKEIVKDALSKQTSSARIFVNIEDNGGGVHEDVYPNILDFGITTRRDKGGTGFGLPAAKEYMISRGGTLKTFNDPGNAFKVEFYLQELDLEYHKIDK